MALKRKVVRPRAAKKKKPEAPPETPLYDEAQSAISKGEAKKRLAAFLERTSNQSWMRNRFGSFERALLGGMRNLIAESRKDEQQGRSDESTAAVLLFLYGLSSTLMNRFFWLALQARLHSVTGRPVEPSDAEDVLRELEVYNDAGMRDQVQAYFQRELFSVPPDQDPEVQRQGRVFDLMNAGKTPKA